MKSEMSANPNCQKGKKTLCLFCFPVPCSVTGSWRFTNSLALFLSKSTWQPPTTGLWIYWLGLIPWSMTASGCAGSHLGCSLQMKPGNPPPHQTLSPSASRTRGWRFLQTHTRTWEIKPYSLFLNVRPVIVIQYTWCHIQEIATHGLWAVHSACTNCLCLYCT